MKKLFVILILLLLPVSAWADTATYEMSNSVDDAQGWYPGNNGYTATSVTFGRFVFGVNVDSDAYLRFVSNIPIGSTITSANLSFRSAGSNSSTFNTTIYGLSLASSPAWQGAGGFNDTNYTNAAALQAITKLATTVSWNTPAAWTDNSWYDSPSITTIMQAIIESADYSAGEYIGFRIDHGDGVYAENDYRGFDSYDAGAAYSAELDVTWTPPSTAVPQVITVVIF
jgi:hypothetical protein